MESIVANLIVGKTRRETFKGREYIVAPLSMIVHGVLNGSQGALYYPEDETRSAADAWEGIPIVAPNHPIHPTTNHHQSATDVGVLDRMGIGHVSKPVWNGKLRAEGWFDVQNTRRVVPDVLARLEAGQPIELSTGLYTDNEPSKGTFNSVPYDAIARNHRPDHLAVLPTMKGACSNHDGCGVLVNAKTCPDCGEKMNDEVKCDCGYTANSAKTLWQKLGEMLGLTTNITPKHPVNGKFHPSGLMPHAHAQKGFADVNKNGIDDALEEEIEDEVEEGFTGNGGPGSGPQKGGGDGAKGRVGKQVAEHFGHLLGGDGADQRASIHKVDHEDKILHVQPMGHGGSIDGIKAEQNNVAMTQQAADSFEKANEGWNVVVRDPKATHNANPEGINQYTVGADGGKHTKESAGAAIKGMIAAVAEPTLTYSAIDTAVESMSHLSVGDLTEAYKTGTERTVMMGKGKAGKLKEVGRAIKDLKENYERNKPTGNEDSNMTREQKVKALVTNCDCWKGDEATLNEFDDAKIDKLHAQMAKHQATELAANTLLTVAKENGAPADLTVNAMPAFIKKKIAAKKGKEDDDDDEDDEDEETTDNSSVVNKPITERLSPSELATWNCVVGIEKKERQRLSANLSAVAEQEQNPQRKALILNKLKSKPSVGEMEELLTLVGNAAQPQRQQRQPSYLGSEGGPEVVGNQGDDAADDILEMPTINYAEMAKEYAENRA